MDTKQMPDKHKFFPFYSDSTDLFLAESPPGERELPVVPLINTVLFPNMVTPLFINRESALFAVEEAMAGSRTIIAVAVRDPENEALEPDLLYRIGVETVIGRVLKMPDGT